VSVPYQFHTPSHSSRPISRFLLPAILATFAEASPTLNVIRLNYVSSPLQSCWVKFARFDPFSVLSFHPVFFDPCRSPGILLLEYTHLSYWPLCEFYWSYYAPHDKSCQFLRAPAILDAYLPGQPARQIPEFHHTRNTLRVVHYSSLVPALGTNAPH